MIKKKSNSIAIVFLILSILNSIWAVLLTLNADRIYFSEHYNDIINFIWVASTDILLCIAIVLCIKSLKTSSEIKYRQNIFYILTSHFCIPLLIAIRISTLIPKVYTMEEKIIITVICLSIILISCAWYIPLTIANTKKLRSAVIEDLNRRIARTTGEENRNDIYNR